MASPTQREIVEGIRRELDVTGRERRFEVVRSSRQQNAIRLDLRPSIDKRKLDYTLEGGAASWHHTASPVVAVSVDEFAVYVQPTNDPVPRAGEVVTIRPPRFLDALLECWMDDVIATACLSSFHQQSGCECNRLFSSIIQILLRPASLVSIEPLHSN